MQSLNQQRDRLSNTKIESNDYRAIIKKYDTRNAFFYLDPPYENSRGLYKDFQIDYQEMAAILSSLKGRFLLSLNDSENIRNIFQNFKIESIIVPHGSGHQDGRKELLISN